MKAMVADELDDTSAKMIKNARTTTQISCFKAFPPSFLDVFRYFSHLKELGVEASIGDHRDLELTGIARHMVYGTSQRATNGWRLDILSSRAKPASGRELKPLEPLPTWISRPFWPILTKISASDARFLIVSPSEMLT